MRKSPPAKNSFLIWNSKATSISESFQVTSPCRLTWNGTTNLSPELANGRQCSKTQGLSARGMGSGGAQDKQTEGFNILPVEELVWPHSGSCNPRTGPSQHWDLCCKDSILYALTWTVCYAQTSQVSLLVWSTLAYWQVAEDRGCRRVYLLVKMGFKDHVES